MLSQAAMLFIAFKTNFPDCTVMNFSVSVFFTGHLRPAFMPGVGLVKLAEIINLKASERRSELLSARMLTK